MILEIDGWQVGLKFSAAHFIPEHGKCSRLHGHDYGVRIRIYGEQRNGIVYDFVELKNKVRAICNKLDHHVLIPTDSDAISVNIEGDTVHVSHNGKNYAFPREDVVLINIHVPSAELLAVYIGRKVVEELSFPDNVKGVEVCVDEGPGQGACEYYSIGD